MEPQSSTGPPLYVHLPFCAAKCPYCDFYSVPGEDQDTGGVIDGVLEEARIRAPQRPITVFFGGGTPSYHSIPELTRLLDGLDEVCGFRSSAAEVTVECNPESLDLDKACALADLGVDRLSIGFQSLDPAILALFGRVHDSKQSLDAFAAARDAGFSRVSVDMIFGAPGQGLEAWTEELSRVLDLGPDHLSAYNLTYEEGTPFHRWLREGRLEPASEDHELELFWRTRELTASAGLEAYEVSNFASKGEECRHNVNYWRNGPYVGLGPSAVSKVGHRRLGRARSVSGWRRAVRDGALGAETWAWQEELEPHARLGETWWLGLRLTEGLSPQAARERAGWNEPSDPTDPLLASLVGEGLLEQSTGRYRLTPSGLPLADHIASRFLSSSPAEEGVDCRAAPTRGTP